MWEASSPDPWESSLSQYMHLHCSLREREQSSCILHRLTHFLTWGLLVETMQEIPTAEKTQLENFSQSCSSFLFLYFPPTLLIIRQCLWMPLNTHGVCSCLSNLSYKVLHITVKTNAVAFICALLNPAVCEAFAYLFFFLQKQPITSWRPDKPRRGEPEVGKG